jgi:hypothetical protein
MNVTEVRSAVQAILSDLGKVKVLLGPTEYGATLERTDVLSLVVQIELGPPNQVNENKVDDLFETVPTRLEADDTLGGLVSDVTVRGTTGHQLTRPGPDLPPVLGAQWSLRITLDD